MTDTQTVAAVRRALGDRFIGPAHHLSDIAIKRVITAVLTAAADRTWRQTRHCHAELWDTNEDYRASLRREMRLTLLDMITQAGGIPTHLPTETLDYAEGFLGRPVSAEAVKHGAHYDSVIVTLTVSIRTVGDPGE